MKEHKYWLFKSEPTTYGIEHLKEDKKTPWNGVRNFQARNYMREMQIGDSILFYHSSCKEVGVYGLAEVASIAYPDPTQFEEGGHYYDPRSKKEKPLWDLVDIVYERTLSKPVLLSDISANKKLAQMVILSPRSRLSVSPVTKEEFEEVINMSL